MSHYQNFEPPFEIPDSWQWAQVNDITTSILYGVSESAKSQGEYKLLRITDIQDNSVNWANVPYTDFNKNKAAQYLLQNGDIVFARTGATVGKSYLVESIPSNSIYASYLIRIRTNEEILPEYLKIFFESTFYWQQIFEGTVGIGQPNVNGTSLGLLWLPIPPRNEQRRIVSNTQDLTLYVTSMEYSKKAINESIIQIKSKILELAMQGKLVPQDQSDEPAAEMLKRINPKANIITDNPHSWNIPSNWTWISVKDVFKPMERKLPSGNQFLYIDIDSIDNKNNTVIPKTISVKTAPSRASRKTIKGDIVFSMVRPYLKNIAIVPEDDCIASTGFYVLSCTPSIDPQFAFQIAISDFFVQGLNLYMKGDNSPSINKDNIENYVIPLPPMKEQKRIVAKIEEIFSCLGEIEASL